MVERVQFRAVEKKERFIPVDTRGKRLADLEDLDIVRIAWGIFLQGEPGVAAVWEKRLYEKYRPIIEGGKEIRLRIKHQTHEKVISICRADPRVIGVLDNRELPIFATIVNDLRVKREKSRRYFKNKEQKRILAMLPPGTRDILPQDIEVIQADHAENNPPVLARVRDHFVNRRNLFGWGAVVFAGTLGVLGNTRNEPPPRALLLKDQAKVQSAPPEVAKVQEVVKDTIANLPPEPAKPEILYRLVDEKGNYVKGAKARFDGVEVETNGAGLIYITGENPLAFDQLVEKELEIELPDGRKIVKKIEVHGGLNPHVLNRSEEFIVVG